MYVLDSNALIEIAKETAQGKRALSLMGKTPAATTSISVQEVLVGVSEKEVAVYESMFEGFQILSHDAAAARIAAKIQRKLKGNALSTADAMIAGICISQGAMLVTFDKAFQRVSELKLLAL